MNDPALFQKTFAPRKKWLSKTRAVDSWKAWRAFLAAIFALPMDAEARATYQKHTGRTELPTQRAREVFLVAGRRSGKSLIASLVAVFLATIPDYSAYLAPGETGVVMILGADKKQCRVILGYVRALLRVPMLRKLVAAELKESVRLTNGITIEIHVSSYRSVRGTTLVAAVCDELAFWSSEGTANPDTEVLAALRPAMLTIPTAMLIGVSSPYARRGALFEAHRNHFGKNSPDTLVWQADSRSMNPTLPESVIAAAYAKDPASAKAEFGALFREDVESFISAEVVESLTIRGRYELPYDPTKSYIGFADPSGGAADSFTMAIGHFENGKAVLDVTREERSPLSPAMVTAKFAQVFRSYGIYSITGDAYAGSWPRDEFQKHGVTYQVSARSKSELYVALLPLLMSGQAQLLDSQILASQLTGLERRTGRAHDSIDHPAGGHDDVSNAVAGALVEVFERDILQLGLVVYLQELASGARKLVRSVQEIFAAGPTTSQGVTGKGEIVSAAACYFCNSTKLESVGSGASVRFHCLACGKYFLPELLKQPCWKEGCSELMVPVGGGPPRCVNHGPAPAQQVEQPGHVHRWRLVPGGCEKCDDCEQQRPIPGLAPITVNGVSRDSQGGPLRGGFALRGPFTKKFPWDR